MTEFPELQETALYGLAGDIVRLIEPQSEAHPAALLAQSLCAFGNLIGRNPHFVVEADKHHTNIFLVLVGETGTGRKGTSWGQVKRIFAGLDDTWELDCVTSGLASGEGLLYHVRDAITKNGEVIDEGVPDKRLLTFEGEFASVLQAQGREGNTLSAQIRSLWDTGDARSLVKNSPIKTTGAHVSIVGHITRHDLQASLDKVDWVNGYVNRFLWFCVERTKFLPRGGQLSASDLKLIKDRLRAAVDLAQAIGEMTCDDEAWVLWDSIYVRLETGRQGLLGKVTQRASPYTLRLACLYALLDCSTVVRREHLEAALAVWQYAEDSARYIFDARSGDRTADTILGALRLASDTGMTTTELHALFARHKSTGEIERACQLLHEQGLVLSQDDNATGGRPAKRWFVVAKCEKSEERITLP